MGRPTASAGRNRIMSLANRYSALGATACICIGFCVLAGQSSSSTEPARRVVEAQSFRLVNSAGELRGEFTLSQDGQPQLRLLDHSAMHAFSVYLDKNDRPILQLNDRDRRSMLKLEISEEGRADLLFKDFKHNRQMEIALTQNGYPMISMVDRFGRQRASMGLTRMEEPYFFVFDESGKPQVVPPPAPKAPMPQSN